MGAQRAEAFTVPLETFLSFVFLLFCRRFDCQEQETTSTDQFNQETRLFPTQRSGAVLISGAALGTFACEAADNTNQGKGELQEEEYPEKLDAENCVTVVDETSLK